MAVALIGSSHDDRIVAAAARAGAHSFVNRLALDETAALIERADLVITTDSGPLHIAGALERPSVGLFRAIRPEYAQLYRSVTPLFWPGGAACLAGCDWESWHGCVQQPCKQLGGISAHAIIAAAERLLAAA